MSTTASSSQLDQDYEDRVREAIPGIIYETLRVAVYKPEVGFNRKFYRKNFNNWPLGKCEEIEIDFFGHVDFEAIQNLKVVREHPDTNIFVTRPHIESSNMVTSSPATV
jgi:hypothetical protein